jgi:large subunit ribosomal protein L23
MRTPALSPNYAKFHVPLWFSKLDLRDYLYHVYNVRITSVRSYVKQQRVEMERVHGRIMLNRWHRPRAKKYMTVELERPFVWPEEPEDYSPWNKEQMEASKEMQEKMSEEDGSRKDMLVNEDRRKAMREQAKALLEGRVRWKPTTNSSTMLAK